MRVNIENKVDIIKNNFMPQQLDIIFTTGNTPLIILCVGRNDNKEKVYKLVSLDSGNRWSDNHDTLEKIRDFVIEGDLDVYRNSELTIHLGERIK